jgi:hypothetical protein
MAQSHFLLKATRQDVRGGSGLQGNKSAYLATNLGVARHRSARHEATRSAVFRRRCRDGRREEVPDRTSNVALFLKRGKGCSAMGLGIPLHRFEEERRFVAKRIVNARG